MAIDAWTNDREAACEKAGIATEEESLGTSLYTSLVVYKVSRERKGRERERGIKWSFSFSVVSVMRRSLHWLESEYHVNTTSVRHAGRCELHTVPICPIRTLFTMKYSLFLAIWKVKSMKVQEKRFDVLSTSVTRLSLK